MATATPRALKQNVYHFATPKQDCDEDMLAWREEINGRIVSMTDSLDDFLRVYVPGSSDPSTLTTARPFKVPAGQLERTMYDPLVSQMIDEG